MQSKIEIFLGDITQIPVDAIVNAANSSLLGGGGVDGAIHAAGGLQILEDCQEIITRTGKCKTGNAVITRAGNLPAMFVIHTVGPIWEGGSSGEPEKLKNCYLNSLKLAVENGVKTISFPGISTGVYGYPKRLAAEVAVSTVSEFMEENGAIEKVIFVCFDPKSFFFFQKLVDFKLKDQYKGCLLGGAIGDALGAPIEFLSIADIKGKYGPQGIIDFVEFPDGIGRITDDTQMTLFSVEGILRAICRFYDRGILGGYKAAIWEAYLRWLWTQGYEYDHTNYETIDKSVFKGLLFNERKLYVQRAPGTTCIRSLLNAKVGTFEWQVNNSKGCGGIMRVAPLGLVGWANSPEAAFHLGAEAAAMTHGHPNGYLSAGFLTCLMSFLRNSNCTLHEAINKVIPILKLKKDHEQTLTSVENAVKLAKNVGKDATWQDIEKLGEGWVGEEALAISLFCSLVHEKDWLSGVLLSVNHSGDSDSTGAITGNILGWINGASAIPRALISRLELSDLIHEMAIDLLHEFEPSEDEEAIEEWYNKYPPF